MDTKQITQDKQSAAIAKAKKFHFAEGLLEGTYTSMAVAVGAVALAGAVGVAGAVGAVALAGAVGVAVAVGAVAVGAVAVTAESTYERYKDAIPRTVSNTYKKLGKFFGFTLPVAAGIAAGVTMHNNIADHQTEAPSTPVPVTAPVKATASITCPAETMEKLTENFNATHDTTLTLPALKQAGCTLSAQQPAP